MCSTPAASMSTVASMASWRDRHGRRRRAGDVLDGRVGEKRPSATAARTSASVRMPRVSSGIATSSAWRCSSPSRRAAERSVSVGLGVDGRAHDRRDRRGAHVVQAVDRMPGAGEALAQRSGHVGHARLGGQHPPRGVGREQGAAGGLARAHGERRRHPGQQRRVAEALAGLQHLDHLALVHDVHRPGERPPTARWRAGRPPPAARRPARTVVDGGLRRSARRSCSGASASNGGCLARNVSKCSMSDAAIVFASSPCEPTATCQGNAQQRPADLEGTCRTKRRARAV